MDSDPSKKQESFLLYLTLGLLNSGYFLLHFSQELCDVRQLKID